MSGVGFAVSCSGGGVDIHNGYYNKHKILICQVKNDIFSGYIFSWVNHSSVFVVRRLGHFPAHHRGEDASYALETRSWV